MSTLLLPVVHVVDDDRSNLTSLSRLLRASQLEVETFASAAEFLAGITPGTAGCIVSDLQMPGMNGFELQAELARRQIAMPVIFLSGHGDISSAVRAMHAGADDFLEKLGTKEKLIESVERALARDRREREARQQRVELQARFQPLTEREREVLRQVVRGQLNKQIAAALGICERTVKLHRSAITTKLGVPSVAELTRMTVAAGLFPDSRRDCP